ncbi:hypothetical protein C7S13_4477 [Burkholderia cepacia]|nr:hypothetical protein [Burkholderia cepacia]
MLALGVRGRCGTDRIGSAAHACAAGRPAAGMPARPVRIDFGQSSEEAG